MGIRTKGTIYKDGTEFTGGTGTGTVGPAGPIGPTGPPGPAGKNGEPGLRGETGLQGVPGYTPIKGVDYFDGKDGQAGPPGTTEWDGITNKPTTFPAATHDHSGIYENANANIQSHISTPHAPANAQANADITKGEIEAKLTGQISSHSHSGVSGGLGYAIQFNCLNQSTMTDGQTVYWGSKNLAQQTSADIHRIYIPKAGTIKVCYIHTHSGTAGTGESWTMNIRKNNSVDTLVQSITVANAHRVWSNAEMNISVVAGDYIEIKEVQPTWSTNPANTRRSGIIYIE